MSAYLGLLVLLSPILAIGAAYWWLTRRYPPN